MVAIALHCPFLSATMVRDPFYYKWIVKKKRKKEEMVAASCNKYFIFILMPRFTAVNQDFRFLPFVVRP